MAFPYDEAGGGEDPSSLGYFEDPNALNQDDFYQSIVAEDAELASATPVDDLVSHFATSTNVTDQEVSRLLSQETPLSPEQEQFINQRINVLTTGGGEEQPTEVPTQPTDAPFGLSAPSQQDVASEARRRGAYTLGDQAAELFSNPLKYTPFIGGLLDKENISLGYGALKAEGLIPWEPTMEDKERRELLKRIAKTKYEDEITSYRKEYLTSPGSRLAQEALSTVVGMPTYAAEITLAGGRGGGLGSQIAAKTVAASKGVLAAEVAIQTKALVDAGRGMAVGGKTLLPEGVATATRNAITSLVEKDAAVRMAAQIGTMAQTALGVGALKAIPTTLERSIPASSDLIRDDQGRVVDFKGPETYGDLAKIGGKAFLQEATEAAIEFSGAPIEAGVAKLGMGIISKFAPVAKREALSKMSFDAAVSSVIKNPKAKALWDVGSKINKHLSDRFKINGMPGEYLEERINMFSDALLNLNKDQEDKPLSERLGKALTFERDNPYQAMGMTLGFLLFPIGSHAFGALKGKAAPWNYEKNRDEAGKIFKDHFQTEAGADKAAAAVFQNISSDTHLNLWRRSADKIRDLIGLDPVRNSRPPPPGSFGYFLVRELGMPEKGKKSMVPRAYENWRDNLMLVAKTKGTDEAVKVVRKALDYYAAFEIIKHTEAKTANPVSDTEALNTVNVAADTRYARTEAEAETVATAMNKMVEEGQIKGIPQAASNRVLFTERGTKRMTVESDVLASVTDSKVREALQQYVTVRTTEDPKTGAAAIQPVFSIPRDEWVAEGSAGKLHELYTRFRDAKDPQQAADNVAVIDSQFAADPGVRELNVAPETYARLSDTTAKAHGVTPGAPIETFGTAAEVSATISKSATPSDVAEEFLHSRLVRTGATKTAAPKLYTLYSELTDPEMTKLSHGPGSQSANFKDARTAIEVTRDVIRDPTSTRSNEVLTKLAVLFTGRTPSSRWAKGTFATRAQTIYNAAATANRLPELQAIVEEAVGKEYFDAVRITTTESGPAIIPERKGPPSSHPVAQTAAAGQDVAEPAGVPSISAKAEEGFQKSVMPGTAPAKAEGFQKPSVKDETPLDVEKALAAKLRATVEDSTPMSGEDLSADQPDEHEIEAGPFRASSEERIALNLVKEFLKSLGLTDLNQYAAPVVEFGRDPLFLAAVKSESAYQRYLSGSAEELYPDNKMNQDFYQLLQKNRSTMTSGYARQLASLGSMHIVSARMGYKYTPDDGGPASMVTSKIMFNNLPRTFARVVPATIANQLNAALEGVGTGRPLFIALIKYIEDLQTRMLTGTRGGRTLPERLQDITGVSSNYWERLGKAKKTQKDKLEEFRKRLYDEFRLIKDKVSHTQNPNTRESHYNNVDTLRSDVLREITDAFTGQLNNWQALQLSQGRPEYAITMYPIMDQVASLAGEFARELERPVSVSTATGKRVSMLSLPSQLLTLLTDLGRDFYYLAGGILSDTGESVDAFDMTSADFELYRKSEFIHSLRDGSPTYFQWVGQLGDKVTPPRFVAMDLMNLQTAEGHDKAEEMLRWYITLYNKLSTPEKQGLRDALMVPPVEIRKQMTANESYPVNDTLNRAWLMDKIHGDLSGYKSMAEVTKRGAQLLSTGSRMMPGVEGGLGDEVHVLYVKEPAVDIHPASFDEKGEPLTVKGISITDGASGAPVETAERFMTTLGEWFSKGRKSLAMAKFVLSGQLGDARSRILVKTAVARSDVPPKGSFLAAVAEAVAKYQASSPEAKAKSIIYVTETSLKKYPSEWGDPVDLVVENADGTFSPKVDLADKHFHATPTKEWSVQLEAEDTIDPHAADLPRQLPLAFMQFPEFREVMQYLTDAQMAEVSKLARSDPETMLQTLRDNLLEKDPRLAEALNDATKRTAPERTLELSVALARAVAKAARLRVATQIHATNGPTGYGPKRGLVSSHITSYRYNMATGEGEWVEDPKNVSKGRTRVSRIISNILRAKGDDEITAGFFSEDGRTRTAGQLLDIKGPTRWKAIHAFARWMIANPNLRPDLFVGQRSAKTLWEIPDTASWEKLLAANIDNAQFEEKLAEFIQVQELDVKKEGSDYVVHIPGEYNLYQRVPTGGANAVGIGRLTTFVPDGRNITFLPIEDWYRTGSDFDIDAWYQLCFSWGDNDRMSEKGNEGVWNRALLSMAAIFRDPKNLTHFYRPVNPHAYDSIVAAVDQANANQPKHPELSLEGAKNTREKMSVGARGVGNTASGLRTLVPLLTRGYFRKPNSVDKFGREVYRPTTVNLPKGGKLTLDFSPERFDPKGAGKKLNLAAIQDDLNTFLNLFLDNGKLDGAVTKLGVDELRAGINVLLIVGSPGVSSYHNLVGLRHTLTDFLSSPAVVNRVKQMRANKDLGTRGSRRQKRKSAGAFADELFAMASEMMTIQRFLNLQFNPPTTALEFRDAQALERKLRNNELELFDLSRVFAKGNIAPEFQPSIAVLKLLGDMVFTRKGDHIADDTTLGRSVSAWVNGFLRDPETGELIKQKDTGALYPRSMNEDKGKTGQFKSLQAVMVQALARRIADRGTLAIPRNFDAWSQNLVNKLLKWKKDYPRNAFLKYLSPGLHGKGLAAFISLNPVIVQSELTDQMRKDAQAGFDELDQDVKDELALYTLVKNGPALTSKFNDAYYNLLGTNYLLILDAAVSREMDRWNADDTMPWPNRTDPKNSDWRKMFDGPNGEFHKRLYTFLSGGTKVWMPWIEERPAAVIFPKATLKEKSAIVKPVMTGGWRRLNNYKGIPITYTPLADSKGMAVGARYDRKRERILISPDGMAASYARYQAGTYRVEGVKPVGTFATLDAFAEFVLEHERQEAALGPRGPGEQIADRENKVNAEATGVKKALAAAVETIPPEAPVAPALSVDDADMEKVSVNHMAWETSVRKPVEMFLTAGKGFLKSDPDPDIRNRLVVRGAELRDIFSRDPEAFVAHLKELLPITVSEAARNSFAKTITASLKTARSEYDQFTGKTPAEKYQQMVLPLETDYLPGHSFGEEFTEERMLEKLPGFSDPLHRLLLHLSNKYQGDYNDTVSRGKKWLRDAGYNVLKFHSSKGNERAMTLLKALTPLMDHSENLEEYPDLKTILADPRLVTFDKTRLVIDERGQQQFFVDTDEQGRATFVPESAPVDPVHIGKVLAEYEAATAADKTLVPWRTLFAEMRKHYHNMRTKANESLDAYRQSGQAHYIEPREKYTYHTYAMYKENRIDEKALSAAILRRFLETHGLSTADLYAPKNAELLREYKAEEADIIERSMKHQVQLAERSLQDYEDRRTGGDEDAGLILDERNQQLRREAQPINERALRVAYQKRYVADHGKGSIEGPAYKTAEDAFIQDRRDRQARAEAELRDANSQRSPEETGRVYSRTFETFTEAARYGYVPDTWLSVDLINRWQRNVSAIEKSKVFLTAMAASTSVDGLPAAVFMRDKVAAGFPSILGRESAFQQLENLLTLIHRHVDRDLVFAINRDADPWEQITKLYAEASMDSHMKDLGYRDAGFPNNRLNFSRIWVQEGAPHDLLMHLASRGYHDLEARGGVLGTIGYTMRMINKFNAFTKHIALTVSFFHHFAQFESFIGGTGSAWLVNPAAWKRLITGFKEARRQLMGDPVMVSDWVRAGMEVSTSTELPDQDSGPLDNALKWFEDKAGKFALTEYTVGATFKTLRHLKALNDHFLWDFLQPILKLQLANQLLSEGLLARPDITPGAMRRDIANLVNDLYGGQNWVEHLWATPFARDVMRSFVFAPDWTISAINSARLSEILGTVLQADLPLSKPVASNFPNKILLDRYWPTFVFLVLFGLPNLIQFLLYLWNKKRKEPDKDMKPFTFMNEAGKQFHVDITSPLQQLGLAKFPPTRGRRVYVQWGKQGLELARWFENPLKSYLGKSSTTVKAALEQLVGVNTAGWDMPWKDIVEGSQADKFGFTNVGGDITKGRIYGLARYAMPLTFVNLLDKRPVTFFASTSLGQSQHQATDQLMVAFGLYAEDNMWSRISGVPHRVKRLEDLVPDIIDGLVKNGYQSKVKTIVNGAAGKIRSRYNFEIANELQRHPDKPDDEKIAEILAKLTRIKGTKESLQQSLGVSMKDSSKTFTLEERKAQREALRLAWKKVLNNRRTSY